MLQGFLGMLVLVIGIPISFTAPNRASLCGDILNAPDLEALGDTDRVLCIAQVTDSLNAGGSATHLTQYYNLGWVKPGQKCIANLVTNRPDTTLWVSLYFVRKINNRASCWCTPVAMPSDTLTIQGDFNGDGFINGQDLALFADSQFTGMYDARFDLNADGRVDAADLAIFSFDQYNSYPGKSISGFRPNWTTHVP